jgi:hypothetical protein
MYQAEIHQGRQHHGPETKEVVLEPHTTLTSHSALPPGAHGPLSEQLVSHQR